MKTNPLCFCIFACYLAIFTSATRLSLHREDIRLKKEENFSRRSLLLSKSSSIASSRSSNLRMTTKKTSKDDEDSSTTGKINNPSDSDQNDDNTHLLAQSPESSQQQPFYMKFFPVYPQELLKFFSLSFMMFWIIFIFTMTRDTKDALIVTNCGAESIAFLKVYGVIPAATAFMILYASLAKRLSHQALFYTILTPFILFYLAFAFVLYPLREVLHPLSWTVPEGGLSYVVNIFRYWTYSLYYIISELWGSAGVPLLFWSCANDVVLIEQVRD